MRCIKHLFAQFVERYFTIMIENYKKKPVSTYLYSVENALTLFYADPKYREWLRTMFNGMIEQTYLHLQNADVNKIDPDLLDDFFGLITRYLRYMPDVVLQSPTLETQLKFGIKIIGVKTTNAAKSLYQFLEMLFKVAGANLAAGLTPIAGTDLLIGMIVQGGYGQQITTPLMMLFVEATPSSILGEFIEDIFLEILKNFREPAVQWFTHALMAVPQQILNNGEKESFILNMRQKPYQQHDTYYKEFFEKYFKRCRTHNSKLY